MDLERDVSRIQDNYWKGAMWLRIAQDRQMWKQHVEAFAQLQDTMAAK